MEKTKSYRKIIEAIREISPKRIYISSDGQENNIKNQKLVKSARKL